MLGLTLASAMAQVLNAAAAPVLARIYGPGAFGRFSVYLAVVSILAVPSSLCYEAAVPIPVARANAVSLFRMAFWLNPAWALLLFGLGWSFPGCLVSSLASLAPVWGLTCLGICTMGMYQAMTAWALRERDYPLLARFRWHQGALQPALKLGLGRVANGMGLVLGDIFGRAIACLVLAWRLRVVLRAPLDRPELARWFGQMRRFRAFAMVSGAATLLNTLAQYLPMLLFAQRYAADQAGRFGLAQSLVGLPMVLLGQAVTQVCVGEAAAMIRRGDPGLPGYLRATLRRAALVGGGPILLVALWGPGLFAQVFGATWRGAGEYARLLSPMYLLQFLAAPVSGTTRLLEAQGFQLLWDSARVVALAAWFLLSAHLAWSDRAAILAFGVGMAVMYLVNIGMVLALARRPAGPEGPKESSREP